MLIYITFQRKEHMTTEGPTKVVIPSRHTMGPNTIVTSFCDSLIRQDLTNAIPASETGPFAKKDINNENIAKAKNAGELNKAIRALHKERRWTRPNLILFAQGDKNDHEHETNPEEFTKPRDFSEIAREALNKCKNLFSKTLIVKVDPHDSSGLGGLLGDLDAEPEIDQQEEVKAGSFDERRNHYFEKVKETVKARKHTADNMADINNPQRPLDEKSFKAAYAAPQRDRYHDFVKAGLELRQTGWNRGLRGNELNQFIRDALIARGYITDKD